MAKYVNAEKVQKAVEKLRREYATSYGENYGGRAAALSHLTVNIPAEDVAPVEHGAWVWDENARGYNLGAFVCGKCHCVNHNLPDTDNRYNPYAFKGSRFCPNCGAKMDKEEVKS